MLDGLVGALIGADWSIAVVGVDNEYGAIVKYGCKKIRAMPFLHQNSHF